MHPNYLELARDKVSNTPLLINIVSRRVRQLNQGHRPMVKADNAQMSNMDVALKEIAEGKMSAELAFTAPRKTPEEKVFSL
jgi:DNA-directed RNA polymerase subunit omega